MRRSTWKWACMVGVLMGLSVSTAWGYYFDDRREMSLSGFAYTRGTVALSNDEIGTGKGMWRGGNFVQHRNFLTLEWRHNLNRLSRDMPTLGPLFQFLNLDSLDYYLNLREEFDGIWEYGPSRLRRGTDGGGGSEFWDKYYGRRPERYPGELVRFKNFQYVTSTNFIEKNIQRIRLFEWYFNITKGPLFIRIGRQNLSWGETDGFRLLDQINPLDNSFAGFLTSLDERRVPLFMLRAQWNFGTVGPIQDLTLEGFVAPDDRTRQKTVLHQASFFNVQTNTSPVMVDRMPCGGPIYGRRQVKGSSLGEDPTFVPCSMRAQGPHGSRLQDSRGGGRILGTIRDFTFSIAHYYTWSDSVHSEANIGAPTPAHLAWDLGGSAYTDVTGLTPDPENNPWGAGDPCNGGQAGAIGVPCGVERSLFVPIHAKRVQITGGSLSFPLTALTSLFVDSSSPLFYLYTTFRGEFAYTRNAPLRTEIHSSAASNAFQRFLTLPLAQNGVTDSAFYNDQYLPGGNFSSEGNCTDQLGVRGCRRGRMHNRDTWAFNIGLDHIQWIRFLNKSNSFTFSAQIFKTHVIGNKREYKKGVPVGLNNDAFRIGVRPRSAAPTGPGDNPGRLGGNGNRTQPCLTQDGTNLPPCDFDGLLKQQTDTELFTLAVSTQYLAGNVRPRFVFFYDWAGAWLIQPGIDWVFWEPFRFSMRYNWIEGRYAGIGLFKAKDSIWFELQYLLY